LSHQQTPAAIVLRDAVERKWVGGKSAEIFGCRKSVKKFLCRKIFVQNRKV